VSFLFYTFVLSNLKQYIMSKVLTVGDKVMWRGGFGGESPKEAIVESIELCKSGSKYGDSVNSVDWSKKDRIVVDLDNGHWARGYQISPI
jgi:hypothetical protein